MATLQRSFRRPSARARRSGGRGGRGGCSPLVARAELSLDHLVAALDGSMPEGSSGRCLVHGGIGQKSGVLASVASSAGASQVLCVVADEFAVGAVEALQKYLAPEGSGAGDRPTALGNEPGVRGLEGKVQDLAPYHGPFDAALLDTTATKDGGFREEMVAASMLMRPGGRVVVVGETGDMPPQAEVEDLVADLPMELVGYVREAESSLAVLSVPDGLWLPEGPVVMRSEVVRGFGRGSAELGFPTANLDPSKVGLEFLGLPRGVYFGWALLKADGEDEARKMVVNVGARPTFADGEGDTVEVHVMHDYGREFYGEEMVVTLLGRIRPELPFPGPEALVRRISADVGLARKLLDEDVYQAIKGQFESGA